MTGRGASGYHPCSEIGTAIVETESKTANGDAHCDGANTTEIANGHDDGDDPALEITTENVMVTAYVRDVLNDHDLDRERVTHVHESAAGIPTASAENLSSAVEIQMASVYDLLSALVSAVGI